MPWSFFGWGVGGADNMTCVCRLLEELGYDSVVGVLDDDKRELRDALIDSYPSFRFECIPADDIRPKKARPASPAKVGLVDEDGNVRDEHSRSMRELLGRIQMYFARETSSRGDRLMVCQLRVVQAGESYLARSLTPAYCSSAADQAVPGQEQWLPRAAAEFHNAQLSGGQRAGSPTTLTIDYSDQRPGLGTYIYTRR